MEGKSRKNHNRSGIMRVRSEASAVAFKDKLMEATHRVLEPAKPQRPRYPMWFPCKPQAGLVCRKILLWAVAATEAGVTGFQADACT